MPLELYKNVRLFPSIRFEYFLTLLKNADFIIGNSSVGVRASEIYRIPAINIGNRQKNRSDSMNIINVKNKMSDILNAIKETKHKKITSISHFGDGKSAKNFYRIISNDKIWKTEIQKQFLDIPLI